MALLSVPSSKDIYLELNGKKIAVVQSYSAKSSRESRLIEAFGETEPVGAVGGRVTHVLELKRVYAASTVLSDRMSFYDISDFNLVVVKPDRRIIYSGCEWMSITESAAVNDVIFEHVTVMASKRMEIV